MLVWLPCTRTSTSTSVLITIVKGCIGQVPDYRFTEKSGAPPFDSNPPFSVRKTIQIFCTKPLKRLQDKSNKTFSLRMFRFCIIRYCLWLWWTFPSQSDLCGWDSGVSLCCPVLWSVCLTRKDLIGVEIFVCVKYGNVLIQNVNLDVKMF